MHSIAKENNTPPPPPQKKSDLTLILNRLTLWSERDFSVPLTNISLLDWIENLVLHLRNISWLIIFWILKNLSACQILKS